MSDTQTHTQPAPTPEEILAKAEADFRRLEREAAKLAAEIEAEPLPPTPAMDALREQEAAARQEAARLRLAEDERRRQKAQIQKQLLAGQAALERAAEEVKAAKRREEREVEEALAVERARFLLDERKRELDRELRSDEGGPEHPAKRAVRRLRGLLGLPVSIDHLVFAGEAGGETHYRFNYHGFHGWVRVDRDGVEVWTKAPPYGGRESDDAADYIDSDLREKVYGPRNGKGDGT